jgi:hypothetical protein
LLLLARKENSGPLVSGDLPQLDAEGAFS